jgi:hypothetical protein
LQRQRHVEVGTALIDREADIDARREAGAEPGHAPQVLRRSPTKSAIGSFRAEMP